MRARLCPTLGDPKNCGPPGSSVRGISQARILEWVAVSSSRESSQHREWTYASCVSHMGRRTFYHCTTVKYLSVASVNASDSKITMSRACLPSFLSSFLPCIFNSLLTRGFLAKTNSCGWWFLFWLAKRSVMSLTLCRLLHSICTPRTPVKSSPAHWVSFSLSLSESIPKNFVFLLF